ncbi:MAG TPA: DinB family protein [Bacteroidia bacterium]|nr:DinB family protein [Bacteroidia bacterium]
MREAISRLEFLCNTIPPKLKEFSEEVFSRKPAPAKWSKKEVIGHLTDSAANNIQRFVRMQYENVPFIIYAQNEWVDLQDYRNKNSSEIIQLWELLNRHIVHILKNVPEKNFLLLCKTNEPEPVTLLWLAEDYVKHLEHHLKQIVSY